MISSDESDEEIRVQWPPQPRRPLWPAMSGNRQPHEHYLRRSSRHTFEGDVEEKSAGEFTSDSDWEDAEGDPRSLHSSKESVTQEGFARTTDHSHDYQTTLPRSRKSPKHKFIPESMPLYKGEDKFHSQNRFRKSDHYENTARKQRVNSSFLIILFGMIVIIAFFVGYAMLFNELEDYDDITNLPEMHTNHMDNHFENILKTHIKDVKRKFPTQKDDLWYHFLAGIKKVTRDQPAQPTTFLLLHTTDAKKTLRCLCKEIADTASIFLNATYPVEVDGEDLRNKYNKNLKASMKPEDNGWFIEQYRRRVERSHTMVVYDLEEVPAYLAQAFHFFCDEVSPLVDKAVYLFTLSIPKYSQGRAMKVAENRLNELWSSDLSDDIRAPLLARITGAAVYVLPERELPNPC